jgi:ATP-dependent protease ClpP protease subunit
MILALLLALLASCVTPPLPTTTIGEPEVVAYNDRLPRLVYDPSSEGRGVAIIHLDTPIQRPQAEVLEVLLQSTVGADDIVIVMNSGGGDPIDAFEMIVSIYEAPAPVTCIATNMVASAAFLVFQRCPRRVMLDGSRLMMHEAQWVGPVQDVLEAIERGVDLDELNKVMAIFACMRLNFATVSECHDHYKGRDWEMTAQEALRVGAVDEIALSTVEVVDALRFPSIDPAEFLP